MSGSGSRIGKLHQVRIIGGRWRGRKLAFSPADGLRPTGDRVRETLFNWLAADITGARCADLFAGTGALGLEALSRGAALCDFVDSSRAALTAITEHLERFDALEQGCCHPGPAQQFLETATQPYDIVFVDPPFNLQLVSPTCNALVQGRLLRDDALVYIESEAKNPPPQVPPGWNLRRDKVAGGVAYRLFSVDSAENPH
jgi:16S rRNA (guanine966-N2)-methyltransferase